MLFDRRLDVPTLEEAKKRVRRRDTFFIVFSAILLFFLFFIHFFLIIGDGLLTFFNISLWVLEVLISYFVLKLLFNKMLDLLQTAWESLDDKDEDEKMGGFKVEKIKRYTEGIAEEMDIKGEGVDVCLVDSTLPNAFGLIWRNVICLDKSWLRLLDEQELKALISHELNHLKMKKTRPVFGHPYMMRSVVLAQISSIVLIAMVNGFWNSFNVLVLLSIIYQWIDVLFFIAPLKSSRAEEHLCDWNAIRFAGIEGAINLMLKMGQRYEAVNIIQDETKKQTEDYSVPLRDYSKIQERIDKNLIREDMTEEGIRRVVSETVDELAEENNWSGSLIKFPSLGKSKIDKLSRATRKHKIDWLQYDDHIRDLKLDKQETRELIDDLECDRKSFLFDTSIDSYKDSHGTHPTLKQRVLFLWNNYSALSSER